MRGFVWKSGCVIYLLFSLFGCSQDGLAKVTITNSSGEVIKLLKVTLGSESQDVENMIMGESVEMEFLVKVDAGYLIYVEFSSGREMESAVGYVTSGFRYSDEIEINNADFAFRGSSDLITTL